MMKKMGKMGKGKMLKQAMKGMFGKGGMDPSQMDPQALEAAARNGERGQCGVEERDEGRRVNAHAGLARESSVSTTRMANLHERRREPGVERSG